MQVFEVNQEVSFSSHLRQASVNRDSTFDVFWPLSSFLNKPRDAQWD
jgi:hypothetical protein